MGHPTVMDGLSAWVCGEVDEGALQRWDSVWSQQWEQEQEEQKQSQLEYADAGGRNVLGRPGDETGLDWQD